MGKFTKISEQAFKELQLEAGLLLKKFDISGTTAIEDNDIICTTTGGINSGCVPTYKDNGEDIDNCPVNTKELLSIESYACTMAFTALTFTPEVIRMSLGAADIDSTTSKITPRMELKDTDFANVWWVGDRSDGGMVAICLKNALSTGGFSLQTTKSGKGQISVTLTGYISIDDQSTVPMEFYVKEKTSSK